MEWAELEERSMYRSRQARAAPWREFVLELRPGVPVQAPNDLTRPGGVHPPHIKRRSAIRQAARKIDRELPSQLIFAEDDAGNTWVGLKPFHKAAR